MKNKVLFRIGDAEVTFRELLVAIILFMIMITIGISISNSIKQGLEDKYIRFETALKIMDIENYNHSINTKLGDIITYGTFYAVTPVTNNRIKGEYTYLQEDEEHYVMKTRTVSYSCNCNSKGQCKTCYKTETYWEWDTVNTVKQKSSQIKFMNNEYDYNTFFNYPESYIETVKVSSKVRFVYYGVPSVFDASFASNTSNGYITSFGDGNIQLYPNKKPEEVISSEKSGVGLWTALFWIFWIILTGGALYGYVYLENDYLED